MTISTDLVSLILASATLRKGSREVAVLAHSLIALIVGLTTMTTLLGAQTQSYPLAPRSDLVEEHFGLAVPDPYRRLEDLESPATKVFVESQNQLTRAYLAHLQSLEKIRSRLTELWNYPRIGLPRREAGRLFYSKNSGLQQQSVVFSRSSDQAESPILDPNQISPDGSIALVSYRVSPDGGYLAYGLAQGGSDFSTWRVRNLKTGRTLPDSVVWVKFSSVNWTLDGRGFFYSRYPDPVAGTALTAAAEHHKVYYHKVGTAQASDLLVYEDPEHPDWFHWTTISEDGRYLWIRASRGGPNNRLYYVDLGTPTRPHITTPVVRLIDRDSAEHRPIGNVGDTLYLRTNVDAPRRRIVAIVLPDSSAAHWRTVVPEHEDVLEDAVLAGGRLVVQYLHDVKNRLAVFARDGRHLPPIPLPGIGTVDELSARNDTPELF